MCSSVNRSDGCFKVSSVQYTSIARDDKTEDVWQSSVFHGPGNTRRLSHAGQCLGNQEIHFPLFELIELPSVKILCLLRG